MYRAPFEVNSADNFDYNRLLFANLKACSIQRQLQKVVDLQPIDIKEKVDYSVLHEVADMLDKVVELLNSKKIA